MAPSASTPSAPRNRVRAFTGPQIASQEPQMESSASTRQAAADSGAAQDGVIRPFSIEAPQEDLDELVDDRSQGVQLATLQALSRYWTMDYDWRACEARLNALPQFTTEIDGVEIHFIHVRSQHENALPLIMTHGWPGSVIE